MAGRAGLKLVTSKFKFILDGDAAVRISAAFVGIGAGVGLAGYGIGQGIEAAGRGGAEAARGVGEGARGVGEGISIAAESVRGNKEAVESITALKSTFDQYGFMKGIEKGCLVVKVTTRDMESAHKLFNDWYSGQLKKTLNDALQKALADGEETKVQFDSIDLVKFKRFETTEKDYKSQHATADWYISALFREISGQPVVEKVSSSSFLIFRE